MNFQIYKWREEERLCVLIMDKINAQEVQEVLEKMHFLWRKENLIAVAARG